MDLKKINLIELNVQEIKEIDGGTILPWWGAATYWVVDNWDDISAGAKQYLAEWKAKNH